MANIVIKGLDELIKNFGRANAIVNSNIQEAIRRSVIILQYDLQRGGYVPVKTGTMKSSIRPTITPLKATIQPNVDYAIYVHQGTYGGHIPEKRGKGQKGMKARPFFEWAVERKQDDVQKEFDISISKITKELTA